MDRFKLPSLTVLGVLILQSIPTTQQLWGERLTQSTRLRFGRYIITNLLAFLFLILSCLAVSAQTTAGNLASVVQQSYGNKLFAGTRIEVIVSQKLSSNAVVAGQTISFLTTKDILLGNRIVIPSGSRATGVVKNVHSFGFFGSGGKMEISCDSLTMPDGHQVPVKIDSGAVISGQNQGSKALEYGLIAGVVVGAISGGAAASSDTGWFSGIAAAQTGVITGLGTALVVSLLVQGNDATLSPDQPIVVNLTQDVPVAAPTPSDSAPAIITGNHRD